MKSVLLLLVTITLSYAGEYAVLQNGFRVYADRHEVLEGKTRLYTKGGNMDLAQSEIQRFEVEEYTKPTAPAPLPAVVAISAAPVTVKELIDGAAVRHGLLPEFVHSVAAAESAYRVNALSPKGAIGLMQLMPGTARELGANPHDPAQNAEAGARYLKQLLLKYGGRKDPVRLALAAYNAGPGAVDRYRSIPPYRETQIYVERVLRKYLAQMRVPKS